MLIFAKGRGRLLGAMSLALACGGGFAATCLFNVSRHGLEVFHAPHSLPLDVSIPFVPGWVWVYMLYYPFCFLPLFLRDVRNDPGVFTRTVLAFGLQFGISFAIFLAWPLRMMHPVLSPGLNGAILKQLYACDLGFNSFPSLHLANIVFVSLLYSRLRGIRAGILVSSVALLIAASTMLVKQHFVLDVVAGAFLGWASYVVAFSIGRPTAKSDQSPIPHPGISE